MAKLFSEWLESFDGFRMEVEEVEDAGENVIVGLRVHGRVRGSAQEVEMPETHVLKMADGKIIEVPEYPTRSQALAALGLAG